MTNEPAAMLHAAATRLQELAGAATPGLWRKLVSFVGFDLWADRKMLATHVSEADADYIAAMSPPVALALAELLSEIPGWDLEGTAVDHFALIVARTILGPGWA